MDVLITIFVGFIVTVLAASGLWLLRRLIPASMIEDAILGGVCFTAAIGFFYFIGSII